MTNRRLLLLSNSKNYGGSYLTHAETAIKDFLGNNIKRVLFIPYAGVRISYDNYAATVAEKFNFLGYEIDSIHLKENALEAVNAAEAIAVGGGNTFQLLNLLYENNLLEVIRERVSNGLPYMGWSAGSNVACPTIRTTNDMPIIQPRSFYALNLIPFQINPHYTDAVLPHHQGETRGERIAEFLELNPHLYVAGLREGSILRITGHNIQLLGEHGLRIFHKGQEPYELTPQDSLNFLLQQ